MNYISSCFNSFLELVYKNIPNLAPKCYYCVENKEGKDYLVEHKVNVFQRLFFYNTPYEDPQRLFRLSLQKNGIPNEYRQEVRKRLIQARLHGDLKSQPFIINLQNDEELLIEARINKCVYRFISELASSVDISYHLNYSIPGTTIYGSYTSTITCRWHSEFAAFDEDTLYSWIVKYLILKEKNSRDFNEQVELVSIKAHLAFIKYMRDSTISDNPDIPFHIFITDYAQPINNYNEKTTIRVSDDPKIQSIIHVSKTISEEVNSIFGAIDYKFFQQPDSFSLAFGLMQNSNLQPQKKSARLV